MRLVIVAVGQRMPDWAQTAYDDYAKAIKEQGEWRGEGAPAPSYSAEPAAR